MDERELLDDFPQLTRDDIRACVAYAAERERWHDHWRRSTPQEAT